MDSNELIEGEVRRINEQARDQAEMAVRTALRNICNCQADIAREEKKLSDLKAKANEFIAAQKEALKTIGYVTLTAADILERPAF